jgi:hypothetical protein
MAESWRELDIARQGILNGLFSIYNPRRTLMKIHSSGGGTGRVRELEHTLIVFTFSQVNEKVDAMVNVVMMRSACPIRELKHDSPIPLARLRELARSHRPPGGDEEARPCCVTKSV